jgi:hypothetical protein
MYIVNFPQVGNGGNFYFQYQLVAADDNTPIQNDQCIVYVQMWARSARGSGDQSIFFGNWPQIYGGGYAAVPSFSASTIDGTGKLTLYDGTLEINIPAVTMQRLLPGYFELAFLIATTDQAMTQQLAVGTVPVYNSGVWSTSGFLGSP